MFSGFARLAPLKAAREHLYHSSVSQDGEGSEKGGRPSASDGVVKTKAEVPPTRKHEVPGDGEPPHRASAVRLDGVPESYPDDSPLDTKLRAFDKMLGSVEQVVLLGLLLVIVCIGAAQAIATKAFNHSFPWSFDAIRGGTFAIAMLAAAFCSQNASHISMDLVTRRATPRGRIVFRVVLGLMTVFATYLLIKVGLNMYSRFQNEGGDHTIPTHYLAGMIPLGGGLIVVHTVIRMVIDLDYFIRGKVPPERAPSAH